MNNILITKDSVFQDPSDEVIAKVSFGVIWHDGVKPEPDSVISPFGWTIVRSEKLIGRVFCLKDSRGEIREVEWGDYPLAIHYSTWEEYDLTTLRERNANQKEKLKKLRFAIAKIKRINDRGGPGSRKEIRELIIGLGDMSDSEM